MDSPYLSSHGSPASPSFYRTAGSSPQQSFNNNAFTSSSQPPPFFNAFGTVAQQQSNTSAPGASQGVPTTGPAALDYASAQLSNYAAQQQNQNSNSNVAGNSMYGRGTSTPGANANANPSSPTSMIPQLSQLPPGMDFSNMTLHSANSSAPASAASSPGWTHRRLPSSSSSQQQSTTHTHNPRIAASAVTGKRLNWGEMICATIYHSEHGRLVIQDLFEQMCKRFPEVQEWAFGKDWEARVKNRIKSTLSIKGHLFIKVPRPPSAAGKGSWWTLSQEAQDAYRENRLAPLLKMSNGGPGSTSHSRSSSRGGTGDGGFAMSAVTSAAPSRFNSPGPASGAATPIKQHASAHPLAQQPFGAASSGSGSPSMQDAQARQAAQLAQLQEQLLKQQQAQRDALPGSYDTNAPPSSGTNMPPLYFDQQTSGPHAQTPFGSFPGSSGQGGFTPTDSDSFLAALSAYQSQNEGIPVPGAQGKQQQQQPNPFGGGSMGGMGMSMSMGMPMSFGSGPGALPGGSSGSTPFESGSFGATINALSALDEQRRRELMRMSDSSGTDSFESSGASASGGSGSGGGSSYGIGSPQSIPHLGGPQSMPFPAAARFAGPGGMGVVPQGGAGGAGAGTGGQGTTTATGMGQGQAPQGGGSALLSSPFDPQGGFAHQQQQQGQGQGQQQGQQAQSQSQQQQQQQQLFLQSFMQGGNGGAHNPFGVSLPGGYALPSGSGGQQHSSFYPPPQTGSNGSGSGNGDQPIAPSPADSTSAFFAFTPATGPVDSGPHSREGTEGLGGGEGGNHDGGGGGGGESALGPMVGNKHRGRGSVSNGANNNNNNGNGGGGGNGAGLQRVDESFSLPPPAQRH